MKKYLLLAVAIACTGLGLGPVLAQSSSTNYMIEESTIGPGGLIDANSNNYNLRASLGDTGVGNTASTNFQLYGGYTTTDQEYLEVSVTGMSEDLGVLTASAAATTTGTFSVRSYLAQGYTVTTISEPPTSESGEQINPLSSPTASSAGTEQFGINLVANTSPTTFGANPDQQPDNTFSFGYAATGYATTNQYKYAQGDVIARSDSSSGQTDYTISYVYNVSQSTPAGKYDFNHVLVVTSTF